MAGAGSAPHATWAIDQTAPIVSLDVPSGIDATTGRAVGEFVSATDTMTLALPKTGLDSAATGTLWVADIGIPKSVYRKMGIEPPTSLFQNGYRVRLVPEIDVMAERN